MPLPDSFINRIRQTFQDEAEQLFESFEKPAFHGLRANTLKISPNELMGLIDFPIETVSWCEEGLYYPENERPGRSPYYHAGLFYIQEPSAMSAVAMLDVHPGDKVLDICAAPGGKSTQIAAKLNGKGVLVANDIRNSRCRWLLNNIERFGVTNCAILNESPDKLSERFVDFFDKILVDAPCSGEGMFRKDSEAIKNYSRFNSDECVQIQKNLLYHADKMLRPGGRIMYSTCTFSQDENEFVVEDFLEKNKHYSILKIDHSKYGFSEGVPLKNAARLWPHKIKGEGHFLALLEKGSDSESSQNLAQAFAHHNQNDGAEKHFTEFCKTYLNYNFDQTFVKNRQSLFLTNGLLPDLTSIRVVRSGFYLGELKNNRFEPSQALAMGIKKEDAINIVDFSIKDVCVARYLKGESFEADIKNGYNLICVDGYPLGWGKGLNGRLKNGYLKSWIVR